MNFSLKRQAVHTHAREVAAQYYIRRGYVPALLVEIAKATASDEAFLKYREDQPRVPAGNGRESGRWTEEGGGNSGDGAAPESEYPDAIMPIYPVETFLAALSGGSVISALRYMLGSIARDEVGSAIQDAAAAIEDYFGGKPDRTFTNDAGDIIMMGNDKKIRFDINNSGNDDPHFHIQKQNSNGDWINAGNEHRYYFRDKE